LTHTAVVTQAVSVPLAPACHSTAGYFHELDVSVYQQQMQLNYMGSLHAVKAVYADMVSRNSGHICFIASTLSLLGEQQHSSSMGRSACLQPRSAHAQQQTEAAKRLAGSASTIIHMQPHPAAAAWSCCVFACRHDWVLCLLPKQVCCARPGREPTQRGAVAATVGAAVLSRCCKHTVSQKTAAGCRQFRPVTDTTLAPCT
jgi:NAD(P)-dependent dehydrogenase (short-subunit alcohol dehydrogenase family)